MNTINIAAERDAPVRQPLVLARPRFRLWGVGALGAGVWLAVGAATLLWPEINPIPYGEALAILCGIVAAVLLAAVPAGGGRIAARIRSAGPWAAALGIFVGLWELATAKTGYLPLPFFPSPQALIEVYAEDWPRLLDSLRASGWLLVRGFAFGACAGFAIGIAMGWWRGAGYWIHPVLRLIGPVPATAWLPLIFFIFPTSASASVFVIALASSFPVAVLTWSGVASVNRDYYDIARTLGANERFLISEGRGAGGAAAPCSSGCSWGSARRSPCSSSPRCSASSRASAGI